MRVGTSRIAKRRFPSAPCPCCGDDGRPADDAGVGALGVADLAGVMDCLRRDFVLGGPSFWSGNLVATPPRKGTSPLFCAASCSSASRCFACASITSASTSASVCWTMPRPKPSPPGLNFATRARGYHRFAKASRAHCRRTDGRLGQCARADLAKSGLERRYGAVRRLSALGCGESNSFHPKKRAGLTTASAPLTTFRCPAEFTRSGHCSVAAQAPKLTA